MTLPHRPYDGQRGGKLEPVHVMNILVIKVTNSLTTRPRINFTFTYYVLHTIVCL